MRIEQQRAETLLIIMELIMKLKSLYHFTGV